MQEWFRGLPRSLFSAFDSFGGSPLFLAHPQVGDEYISFAFFSRNSDTVSALAPLRFESLPGEDWFFQTMQEAIIENRQRENEADG